MQHLLDKNLLSEIKKAELKLMEFQLKNENIGSNVECPSCHYISKNKRFSGKIFQNEEGKSFKCFSCGLWRKLQ